MDKMVRKVLARYFEEPGEKPSDSDRSWMEYLRDKSKVITGPDNPVFDMLKGKNKLETSFNTTNPYDYEGPSDMPKDQKDSPPFESVISEPTQIGYFNKPDTYGEQSELGDWWKSREEDYTQDEDEQQPAISLTRHRLAADGFGSFSIPVDDFYDFMLRSKVAASLNQILDKDFHYKNDLKLQRAAKCQALWVNKNKPEEYERGYFVFNSWTPGSKHGMHSVYLQFLKDENTAATTYADYPVHIGCTCPSFLFHGAQYYAVQGGYMYMPAFKPDLVAPRSQEQYVLHPDQKHPQGKKHSGRGLNFRVCKHILAVFDEVKKTPIEVHYKKYPITAPPSAKYDKDVWKQKMKFDFTEANVKQRLMASVPKVPAYFNRESITPSVIDWFKNTWFPRTDDEKSKALKEFALFPDRVFFILIEEAYLKSKLGGKISKKLADEGYELMYKVIQPDSEEESKVVPEREKDQEMGEGKIDVPTIKPPAEEEETEDIIPGKPKREIKKKQYGVPSAGPQKVKQPGKLKRPSTVQPAIK